MTKMPWFKCYPEKLLGALAGLTADEGYLYVIALLRIYDAGGPIMDTAEVLALRAHMPVGRAKTALQGLVSKQKVVIKNGVLSNPVADDELTSRKSISEVAKSNAKSRWQKSDKKQGKMSNSASPPHDVGNAIKIEEDRGKKERKKDIRPAKQDTGVYSEEFEDLWKLYPRTKNTSKKKAHDVWRMLNDENRERVRIAVPIFAEAMRREGRPDDKIKHMQFWLTDRMYETAMAEAPAAKQAALDWHKTATREQWIKVLAVWRKTSDWRESWGPAPGMPGCGVHDGLLTDAEKCLVSQSRVPRNVVQAAE